MNGAKFLKIKKQILLSAIKVLLFIYQHLIFIDLEITSNINYDEELKDLDIIPSKYNMNIPLPRFGHWTLGMPSLVRQYL